MKRAVSLLLLPALLLLTPNVALADDTKATRLYEEALSHFNDPNPTQLIQLANQALEEAASRKVRWNCLLLLGRIHQSKTGEFGLANRCYDQLVQEAVGVKTPVLKRLKANAFLGLGTILYVDKGNVDLALAKYKAAHDKVSGYRMASTADVLSQFIYRQGRLKNQAQSAKTTKLEASLKLAQEALTRTESDEAATPSLIAKYRLQLVIVLWALDRKEPARTEWAKIQPKDLQLSSLYQQALLRTLQGEPPAQVVALLKTFMAKTRPTPLARNRLRKFIRLEPDFQPFLENRAWREFMKDEPTPPKAWPVPAALTRAIAPPKRPGRKRLPSANEMGDAHFKDLSGTVGKVQAAKIDARLKAISKRTGIHCWLVAIYRVSVYNAPQQMDTFCDAAAQRWELNRRSKAVLVIVSVRDKSFGIHRVAVPAAVGERLKKALTKSELLASLEAEKVTAGLEAAAEAMNALPAAPKTAASKSPAQKTEDPKTAAEEAPKAEGPPEWMVIAFILAIVVLLGGVALKMRGGQTE